MGKELIEGSASVIQDDAPEPQNSMIATKSIFDIAPGQFKKGLERRQENRTSLFEWLKENLVEGVDFGRIHVIKKDQCSKGKYCDNPYHFSKPSLWKSGAEKITGMLGLRVTWPDLEEAKRDLKNGKKVIILTCHVVNNAGQVLSEGMGARDLKADFDDVNKAIKMAKKSSMIDAVLNAGGMSEVFTQDVEDMDPEKIGGQDPFNPDEEPTGEYFKKKRQQPIDTHCPIGQEWKGKLWKEVDQGFLSWIILNVKDKPDLVTAAKKELSKRGDTPSEEAEKRHQQSEPVGKKLSEYANELTIATHIDQVIALKDELPIEFEPALRNFIKTREKELGPQ